MGTLVTVVIGIAILVYAATIIRKSIKQVKAGKCMSCSVKSDDCHCHELHGIINLEEGDVNDKKD